MPDHTTAKWQLGIALLSAGQYTEGWDFYDFRDETAGVPIPTFNFPRWQGQPVAGRSLLVLGEQGHGDEIQFCRYVPVLKALGAAHVTIVCRSNNIRLFETLHGVDAVASRDESWTGPPHDYWTLLMSIPRHCKTTLENIPAKLPYLFPSPERVEMWKSKIPQARLRVGLVWKGSSEKSGIHRSLPKLSTLEPLWRAAGHDTVFVSLQKGAGEQEAMHPPAGQPLINLAADTYNFADTAAIVSQLDLVISVDTAVAHLAGALNKPCWVMLACFPTDWRWMHGRADSPWYPHTLLLFRQVKPGEWSFVVEQVAEELKQFIPNPRGVA